MRGYYALGAFALAVAIVAGCEDDLSSVSDTIAPARITDLAVSGNTDTSMTLTWTATGDNDSIGRAGAYVLKRSAAAITEANFAAATTVPGVPAPQDAGAAETFTVTGLDSTLTYYFAIRADDEDGNRSPVSNNAVWTPRGVPVHRVKDIPPARDNSMFEEGDYSNGKGEYIFTGNNKGGLDTTPDARRALLVFAIADSLPAGAAIDSVQLTLRVSKTIAPPNTVALHRLSADWGEGASDAQFEEGTGDNAQTGDVTWTHRFFNTTAWTTPGGDFVAGPVASRSVASNGFYTWKSAGMAADVQSWLDSPATNFGWIVIGDETTDTTAKRFDSRENPVAANRPKLTVYYTTGP
jgi:hypothetical protein